MSIAAKIINFNSFKRVKSNKGGLTGNVKNKSSVDSLLEAYRCHDLAKHLKREYTAIQNDIYVKELKMKRKKEEMQKYNIKALQALEQPCQDNNQEAIRVLKDLYPSVYEQSNFKLKKDGE